MRAIGIDDEMVHAIRRGWHGAHGVGSRWTLWALRGTEGAGGPVTTRSHGVARAHCNAQAVHALEPASARTSRRTQRCDV